MPVGTAEFVTVDEESELTVDETVLVPVAEVEFDTLKRAGGRTAVERSSRRP